MENLEPTRMPDGKIRLMAQQKNAPSIGRIVLFSNGTTVNDATEFVAIIGQVFADPGNPRPYCNLWVMPPFAAPYWEGSVQEWLDEPPMPGRHWRWPPRV